MGTARDCNHHLHLRLQPFTYEFEGPLFGMGTARGCSVSQTSQFYKSKVRSLFSKTIVALPAQWFHTFRSIVSYGSLNYFKDNRSLTRSIFHIARSIVSYVSLNCFIWFAQLFQRQCYISVKPDLWVSALLVTLRLPDGCCEIAMWLSSNALLAQSNFILIAIWLSSNALLARTWQTSGQKRSGLPTIPYAVEPLCNSILLVCSG